jgi:HD-like signal output (HDOD) protein
MRSPVFSGTAPRTQKMTLKEIIARLGVKKVGAIAQQVKMINSLVKPEESEFDLKRFWEHSVGSAIIADKLQADGIVKFSKPIEFNEYWTGTLLHDVGKLVLGSFSGTGLSRSRATAPSTGKVFARLRSRWVMSPVTPGLDSSCC